MILPAMADDALEALRAARDVLGYAIDELRGVGAPTSVSATFVRAMDAVSWSVEQVSETMSTAARARRDVVEMEAVEERRVEGQMFPWMELP